MPASGRLTALQLMVRLHLVPFGVCAAWLQYVVCLQSHHQSGHSSGGSPVLRVSLQLREGVTGTPTQHTVNDLFSFLSLPIASLVL